MELTAKYKHDGRWIDFDMVSVAGHDRNHLLALFANKKIPVAANQDGMVITNNAELHALYIRQKKKVMMFDQCQSSSEMFSNVGFI